MAAISSGSPQRPSGVRERILRLASASFITTMARSVRMVPGPMALTLMPASASANAMTLVNWLSPPLATV